MARSVRRYGKGLNSFLYRPNTKTTPVSKLNNKTQPKIDDPDRYVIQGFIAGNIQVMDKVTGMLVASQLDSREEAQEWISSVLNRLVKG